MNLIKNIICVAFLISMQAYSQEISKEQWMSAMKTALPTAFCNENAFFRQCFNVTDIECENTSSSATRICLNDMSNQIPEILNQPIDGTFWGTKVGSCAGMAYEITLTKKRIHNINCDNPQNWQ